MLACSNRCFIKSMRKFNDKVNLTLNSIHCNFSPLLALNGHKSRIKNQPALSCNFPHTLWDVSTEFDILCFQQLMLNTDFDIVLLV